MELYKGFDGTEQQWLQENLTFLLLKHFVCCEPILITLAMVLQELCNNNIYYCPLAHLTLSVV